MLVKAIMVPSNQLHCISVNDTLDAALSLIENNRLLSLPVVDGKDFVGVLSKQYVYEYYFREYEGTKEDFLKKKVKEFIKTQIMTIDKNVTIEEAAAVFITSKIRFIPITDKHNELLGIVTHQAIFKEYQKLFGDKGNALTIYTYDFKGTLAQIAKNIAKAGGNIKNVVSRDTDVMGLQEVYIRVETDNFKKVVRMLREKGFDVRSAE